MRVPVLLALAMLFVAANQPGKAAVNRIAFASDRDGDWEIYVMDVDSSNVTQLTENSFKDDSPSWSPNGNRIAFSSDRNGNFDIFTMNADGSDQTLLPTTNADDLYPDWSPDATRIAFTSNRDGNYEIYVMNSSDGSNVVRLTHDPADDEWPDWSPAGTEISFFSDRTGNYDTFVMDTLGTILRNCTEDEPARDWLARWSSGGGRIAFSSFRTGDEELYLMNADCTGQAPLTVDSPGSDHGPCWSPDDSLIAFNSERDGDFDIYIMNTADWSIVTQLTDNAADDRGPAWQPHPRGACCTPEGICAITTEDDCAPPNAWHGTGTTCSPSPCVGACCNSITCECTLVTREADCDSSQNPFLTFLGLGTTCESEICDGLGACCISEGRLCEIRRCSECAFITGGYGFLGVGSSCDPFPDNCLASGVTAGPESHVHLLECAVPEASSGVVRCSLHLSGSAVVRIAILSVDGRVLFRQPAETMLAGSHPLTVPLMDQAGNKLVSGVYFLQIDAPGEGQAERVVLVR